ncbi:MAG: Rieske 2Fe-2S domain-containing protein [Planctomycetes bacterium]|nr:Rieske 2Fe-2S domain-containing protein [Planctomycetota bacterium]
MTSDPNPSSRFVRAARFEDVRTAGCQVVQVEGHTIALFSHADRIYAVDNRCPHMGFPLDKGSVKDCIAPLFLRATDVRGRLPSLHKDLEIATAQVVSTIMVTAFSAWSFGACL